MELRSNGRTLRIVAGGPSLKDFNFNKLKTFDVLAVNRSFEYLPFAKYIYFTDWRFFDWYKSGLLQHPAQKYTVGKVFHPEVIKYRNVGASGFTTNPKELKTGNNSAYAAINLAYHLGYMTVIVYGLDMKFKDGASHFHPGHPIKNKEETLTRKMLPFFDTLKEPLEKVGMKVYNANPDSAVEVFEKITIEESLLIT